MSVQHRICQLSGEELEHVGVIPSGLFSLSTHTTLALTERSRLTMLSATLRRSARLRAAVRSRTRLSSSRKVTFEHPVQRVLHRPVHANSLTQDGRAGGTARREVADFALDFDGHAVDLADAL